MELQFLLTPCYVMDDGGGASEAFRSSQSYTADRVTNPPISMFSHDFTNFDHLHNSRNV